MSTKKITISIADTGYIIDSINGESKALHATGSKQQLVVIIRALIEELSKQEPKEESIKKRVL